ncbi:hypothetical protein QE152_g10482 [Popillia japonica]|uniref:Uncharacterized protein n=1 Tax=Popillia japonica TaxID=7064 RepID=A0AAW1LW76_POPJA
MKGKTVKIGFQKLVVEVEQKEERMKGKTVKIGFQKLVVEVEQWRWSREKEKWNREGREVERKRETPGKMPKKWKEKGKPREKCQKTDNNEEWKYG